MKLLLTLLCICLNCYEGYCQDTKSLIREYYTAKTTESKIDLFFKYYSSGLKDSIPAQIFSLIQISDDFKEKNDLVGMGAANLTLGYRYISIGDYTNSLRYDFAALKNFGDVKDSSGITRCFFAIGNSFTFSKNFEQALVYLKKAVMLAKRDDVDIEYADNLNAIAYCMIMLKKPDSAFFYIKEAINIGWEKKDTVSLSYYISTLGQIYLAKKDYKSAKPSLIQSLEYAKQYDLPDVLGSGFNDLSELFYETEMFDSSIYYARKGIYAHGGQSSIASYEWLYKSFEKQNKKDSVTKYFKLAVTIRDSLFSAEKIRNVAALNFQQQFWEKEKEQELIQARKDFNNKLTLYISFGIALIIFIVLILLYRTNQQQKKSKRKIEKAYSELKSTQAQLIQSEKMASLGELTAGIAHEIQNPLNFVNNFSELNTELIDELQTEIKSGNSEEAISISNDIKENSEKINHHGNRAGDIVKGMLQHSRTSTGVKEATDINALADEYLRLSYHGLRAKDKNFKATMKADFDESIGKINIVPQDIGRVLLNLFNNAFYACTERSRSAVNEQKNKNLISYEPTVTVTTKKVNDEVEIRVSDNGNGISPNIVDKIFQPFFTTKPTGEGTGLGLSLSYDIIKAHGGEIKVESKEDEGSEFIIKLRTK